MRTILVLVSLVASVALLFALTPVFAQDGADGSGDRDATTPAPAGSIELKNRTIQPDPEVPLPTVDADGASHEGPVVYVRYARPMNAGERLAIEEAGGRFVGYAHPLTYFVRIPTPAAAAQLGEMWQSSDKVLGTAVQEPGDKIGTLLRRDLSGGATGPQEIYVQFHVDVPAESVVTALANANAMVRWSNARDTINGLPWFATDEPKRLAVRVDASAIAPLLASNAVSWVEIRSEHESTNQTSVSVANADTLDSAPYNLDGTGIRVGVWDGGAVLQHNDFGSRVTIREPGSASSHATHVTGTILGDGSNRAAARGFAPGSTGFSYNFNGNIQAERRGLRHDVLHMIDNHSYSFIAKNFGDYSGTDEEIDRDARDLLVIRIQSAGNDGSGSTTVNFGQTFKNGFCVAALQDNTNVAGFSSRGPVNDGRVRPNIAANGVGLLSTESNGGYSSKSGTSMSSPSTSGAMTLIAQAWGEATDGQQLYPDFAMAAFSQVANDLGNDGPDYVYGNGLIDTQATVDLLLDDVASQGQHVMRGAVRQNQTAEWEIELPSAQSNFQVSLAWLDQAANPAAAVSIVDDLDVTLISPSGTTHFPWSGLLGGGSQNHQFTRTGRNQRDNIEIVRVDSAAAGTWTVRVSGSNLPSSTRPVGFVLASSEPIQRRRAFVGASVNGSTPDLIPDNNTTGLTYNFDVRHAGDVENLRLYLTATHTRRSDLEVRLQHPDGTSIELEPVNTATDSRDDIIAIYPDTRHVNDDVTALLSKAAQGTWTVRVRDTSAGETGSVHYIALEVDLDLNEAPELDNLGVMALDPTNEDDLANNGTTIPDLIASASGDRITDGDTGAVEGIAVIDADITNGTWEFSTNNGSTWSPLGAVSTSNARLLAADTNTRIRFLPGLNFNGTIDPAILFHAWDQTYGLDGETADLAVVGTGGVSALSSATETASLEVLAVNDPPSLTDPGLQTIGENVTLTFAGPTAPVASDVDGLSNSVIRMTLLAYDGTVDLGSLAGLSLVSGANGEAAIVVEGPIGNVNAALDGLEFTPRRSFTGMTTIDVILMDDGSTGLGGPASDTFPLSIEVLPAPDIEVYRTEPTPEAEVFSGDADLLGGPMPVGQPMLLTWTLRNVGSVALDLPTGIAVAQGSNANTSILSSLPSSIAPGDEVEVQATITGTTVNTTATVTLAIGTNDPDEAPFLLITSFDVGPAPQLEVERGSVSVAPESTDEIGDLPTIQPNPVTYTLRNAGDASLSIDRIRITNPDNASVTLADAPATINASATGDLVLNWTIDQLGRSTVDIEIETNDPLRPVFAFTARADGIVEQGPAFEVHRSPIGFVPNGTTDDIGKLLIGEEATRVWQLRNLGTSGIDLLEVSVESATNLTVAIDSDPTIPVGGGTPPSVLAGAESRDLGLRLEPTSTGEGTAEIVIMTSLGEYRFTVRAEGTNVAAPEIRIWHPEAGIIEPGGDIPLGPVQAGTPKNLELVIVNRGTRELVLTEFPSFGTAVNATARYLTLPPMTLEAGGGDTFVIRVTPIAAGLVEVPWSVSSNDPVTPVYSATITTAGQLQQLKIERPERVEVGGYEWDWVGVTGVGSTVRLIYRLTNTGYAPLSLTADPTVDDLENAEAVVATLAELDSTTIAPSETIEVFVDLTTPDGGEFSGTVTFFSNDPANPEYTVTFHGLAASSDDGGCAYQSSSSNWALALLALLALTALVTLRRRA